jgi:hypothetical protein
MTIISVSSDLRRHGGCMEHTDILDRNWRDCELSKPLYPTLVFTRDGLAGGRAGTLLADFGKASRRDEQYATRRLLLDGQEARTHSLLSAAYNRPVAPRIIDKIRRAGNAGVQANACWRMFIRLSSAFRRSTNRAHTGSILRIGPSRKELAQGTWGAVTRSPILKRTE